MNMLFAPPPREIILRPHQEVAVVKLRDGIRSGARRQILVAPCGFGKTECSAHIIKQSQSKGATAWFIVDRVALIDQTSDRFAQYGIDHGIIQADHWLTDRSKPVQIASAQTLARRSLPELPDLIIVDEAHCFPPGTLIATTSGPKAIENIRHGDLVFNATGVGCVQQTFRHQTNQPMAIVRFEDGSEIKCTANHRFFTEDLWREARFLDGKSVVGIEGVPSLWQYLSSEDQAHEDGGVVGGKRAILAKEEMLLAELCKEIEEPDAQHCQPLENGSLTGADRPRTNCEGRQWSGANRTAAAAIAKTWSGMGARICRKNEAVFRRWLSASLQDRCSESSTHDRDRGRWAKPHLDQSEGEGSEESRSIGLKRVVSVQIDEQRSNEVVYNLQVSGHPSYFANGCLVHNCRFKSTMDLIARAPEAKVLGLTATPFTAGMAEEWDGIVNGETVNNLIAGGYLAPIRIRACVAPDMTGAKKKFTGEYDDNESGARGVTIVGDVVQTWVEQTRKHFGGPAKTIVFSPSVAHGAELCRQFAEAGYNFQQLSYLDAGDDERRAKIAEFRKPDSAIHGLVSCAVLTKGFDVNDVMVGISCRPYRKSFSSHVQEMGRVMRTAPSKEYGLWLDHSGNAVAFADDTAWLFEYGVESLSDAQKRDSEVREPKEKTKKDRFCGCCGLMLGVGAMICAACGWEKPQRGEIEIVQGDLVDLELKASEAFKPRKGLRADCLRDPRGVWNAALAYCFERSRKGQDAARKWSYSIWKGIYPESKLPHGLFNAPCSPSTVTPEQYSLIDREVSRFRKTRQRAAA